MSDLDKILFDGDFVTILRRANGNLGAESGRTIKECHQGMYELYRHYELSVNAYNGMEAIHKRSVEKYIKLIDSLKTMLWYNLYDEAVRNNTTVDSARAYANQRIEQIVGEV